MSQGTGGWIMVESRVPVEFEEMLCAVMVEQGSLGMEISDSRSDHRQIRAFFDAPASLPDLLEAIRAELRHLPAVPDFPLTASFVPEQDWVVLSRHSFRPTLAGDHFVIHPSWEMPPAGMERISIQIDPEQAFGTGTHETTRLCIRLMEEIYKPGFSRCLDAGCGSGILLLALAKWIRHRWPGQRKSFTLDGVEVDAVSVDVARRNIRINAPEIPISIHHQSLEEFSAAPYDFVFANMLSEILRRNLGRLHGLLRPSGRLVLTGILDSEAALFRQQLAEFAWRIDGEYFAGEWCAFVMQRER
ncbi:MAG: 50S ribosomal protein L11 methyltransferase [Acidobacteria bacterium]|nr:50S ribosomal protein L11 methyltransferase [Acidobacteriota bacterium]